MASLINADNGVVSGSAGVKTTADSSGVLALQTNGTTALSISTAQVVSFTNSPTYTAGTANGVAYLNASKVLTTGSALTFDGATLTSGTGGTGATNAIFRLNGSSASSYGVYIQFQRNSVSTWTIGNDSAINGGTSDDLTIYGTASQRFYASSAEQMRLTSTGLGIGTSSPAYKLDVRGGLIVAGNGTIVGGISYSTRPEIGAISNHPVGFITNNTTQMLLDTSGNLGIGTSSPATKLDVVGTVKVTSSSALSQSWNCTTGAYTSWQYNGTTVGDIGTGNNAFSGGATGDFGITSRAGNLVFGTGSTERARIDTSGNLGIGTNSPAYKLDVNGVANFAANVGHRVGTALFFAGTGASSGLNYLYTNTTALVWRNAADSAELMRLDNSGNLLVGATNSSSSAGAGFKVTSPVAGHWDAGIVTTANNASYSCWDIYSTATSSYRFYVTTTGVINAVSNTITTISDQRLKENIRDLDDGLATVMALKPRKFDWKESKGAGTKNARGFIAQEFEQVFPDLIDEWKDPAPEGEEPYKAVRADLIPTLVKAVQEQQALIESLTARLNSLENK